MPATRGRQRPGGRGEGAGARIPPPAVSVLRPRRRHFECLAPAAAASSAAGTGPVSGAAAPAAPARLRAGPSSLPRSPSYTAGQAGSPLPRPARFRPPEAPVCLRCLCPRPGCGPAVAPRGCLLVEAARCPPVVSAGGDFSWALGRVRAPACVPGLRPAARGRLGLCPALLGWPAASPGTGERFLPASAVTRWSGVAGGTLSAPITPVAGTRVISHSVFWSGKRSPAEVLSVQNVV